MLAEFSFIRSVLVYNTWWFNPKIRYSGTRIILTLIFINLVIIVIAIAVAVSIAIVIVTMNEKPLNLEKTISNVLSVLLLIYGWFVHRYWSVRNSVVFTGIIKTHRVSSNKNWLNATNSNFLIPISLQANDVNLNYFKL